MSVDPKRAQKMIERLLLRFKGTSIEMLEEVLFPLRAPLTKISTQIERFGSGWGSRFEIGVGSECPTVTRGRSGKVVPKEALTEDSPWRELLKARIHKASEGLADGELHGGNKGELKQKLSEVEVGDILEIDRYGITAKLESALTEAALVKHAQERGYKVTRMPEDIAQHLGKYWHIDFVFEKNGIQKKVESKSLWGTDTRHARLIHSRGKAYLTSSCKFSTQDFFAVNLWLRTGCITDVAFARSVRKDHAHPHGLPCATKRGGGVLRSYVHQNPLCNIGDGVWFASIDDVWNLP